MFTNIHVGAWLLHTHNFGQVRLWFVFPLDSFQTYRIMDTVNIRNGFGWSGSDCLFFDLCWDFCLLFFFVFVCTSRVFGFQGFASSYTDSQWTAVARAFDVWAPPPPLPLYHCFHVLSQNKPLVSSRLKTHSHWSICPCLVIFAVMCSTLDS